jgi:hypothetical protein
MKVSQAIDVLKDLGADDDVFCPIFIKEEADDMGAQDTETEFRFEGSEWAKIVSAMETDDGLWQELTETFRHYVDKQMEAKK